MNGQHFTSVPVVKEGLLPPGMLLSDLGDTTSEGGYKGVHFGPRKKLYVIGSLRNPKIPSIAAEFRKQLGFTWWVFDDWYAAGPEADDYWKKYEQEKGNEYIEALKGEAAQNVFKFDKRHLDSADAVVLALPAGKSGHLEFGYMLGTGKPGYILLDADDVRWDVMYQFATGMAASVEEIAKQL